VLPLLPVAAASHHVATASNICTKSVLKLFGNQVAHARLGLRFHLLGPYWRDVPLRHRPITWFGKVDGILFSCILHADSFLFEAGRVFPARKDRSRPSPRHCSRVVEAVLLDFDFDADQLLRMTTMTMTARASRTRPSS
jgi:hypothetical protein